MRRPTPFRGAMAGVVAAVALAGCSESTGSGDGAPVAQLSVRPVLPSALSEGAFDLAVDRIRLRLIRPPGEQLLDSVFFFPADSSQLAVRVKVPLNARRELLDLSLELRAGTRLLFAGTSQVEVSEEASVAPSIPLQYVGPGTEMSSLRISPRDSVLKPGDVVGFGVQAFSASGPLPGFYVGWSTSDPATATVNANGILRAPGTRGAVTVRVVSPTGIKDSTRVYFSPPPTVIQRVSGDGQSSQAGLQLAELLGVRILAADQQGVPGIRVRFISLSGGRTLDTLVISDVQGYARTGGVLGPAAGPQFFEASAPGLPIVSFTATALAGPPTVITAIGGNNQVGTVGTPLPTPLTVRVTDGTGNAIAGVPLTWQILSGGGTLTTVSATVNLSGVGFADLTLGRFAGSNRVRVRIPNGAFADFFVTALPGAPATLRILEGNLQSGPAGAQLAPFVVDVADSLDNLVPGTNVRWTEVQGGGLLTPLLSTTDAVGRATTSYRLPATSGTVQVTADVPGTTLRATFQVTVTPPPSP